MKMLGASHQLVLNPDAHDRFTTDGFVALRQFLDAGELRDLLSQVERFMHEVLPRLPDEHVFYEEVGVAESLKQIQQMGDHDAWFGEFCRQRMQPVAEWALGGAVVHKNMQYFNKPALIGQPTPPHQDGYYFMLDPCEATTMWLALDEVDEENGCVRYVRGSHHHGIREHARTQTLGFSQGIADYPTDQDSAQEVAVLALPGDLLVHDARTIHRADGNQSKVRSRRALGFIYYSQRAREDKVAHAVYQEKLARDWKRSGKL